ncbi:hypothetical protein DYB25_007093, partial [Aphanomyces astaci]
MVCNSADVDALRSAVASLGIPHIHVKQDCSPLRLSRNARNAVAAAYEYLQIGAVVVSPYLLTSLKCLDDHGGNAVVAGSVMATWAASLVAGSMVPTRTSSPRLVLIAATAPLGLTALVNQQSFENVYSAPSLRAIPWLNVAGNHDLGGNSFICGDADGHFRECSSVDELVQFLDIRFQAQAKSITTGTYLTDGVSVDIFNLDTNHAAQHGAQDVCCQCFGYAAKFGLNQTEVCDDVMPGDLGCAGGNREMLDACVDKIEAWAKDSYARAMVDMKASTATFKVVNTHYSPHYHMNSSQMMQWYTLCREAGVTVWFNGHTHGFNHDIATWGTHFFENGGGGGYWTRNLPGMNNGLVKNQWRVVGNPYGIMELRFSKDWLQVQFATFDDQWTFGGMDRDATVVGGLQRGSTRTHVDITLRSLRQPAHMMHSLSVKKKNESVGLLEPKHTHATWVAPSTLAKVGLVSVSACAAWIFLASSPASPSLSSLRIDPASSRASFEDDGAMSLRVSRTHLVNPETSVPEVTFLAIGDWGGTLGKDKGDPGSCCQLYNGGVDTRHTRYKVDYYAQAYVAELMAQSAAELHPSRILGHGDNFYWNGVGTGDANYRLEQTFEKVYNASTLQNVPWLNVAGNHDIGGATFICGEADGAYRECKDEAELLAYLDIRFEAQANYTSPYNNRWNLRGHYYVERIVKNDVSVEVYNVDTNHAENHGSKDVCCQCYGYASQLGLDTGVCNDPQPGDVACVGGNVTLFNACVAKIESWANESLTRAMADMKASTATFKIVNTHYSPHYHMDPVKMEK